MMRTVMEILFCVSLFPKGLVTNGTIIHPQKENVEKGKATIHLNFHCELDVVRLRIKVVKKPIEFLPTMRPDDIGIINKPLPKLQVKRGRSQHSRFRVFHKQVCDN